MAALTGQQAGMAALVQQAARDPTLFAAQLALADEELMARLDPHSRQHVHDILAGGMTAHPEPSVASPAATTSRTTDRGARRRRKRLRSKSPRVGAAGDVEDEGTSVMSGHAFDVLRTGVKVDTKRFGGHMPSKATRSKRNAGAGAGPASLDFFGTAAAPAASTASSKPVRAGKRPRPGSSSSSRRARADDDASVELEDGKGTSASNGSAAATAKLSLFASSAAVDDDAARTDAGAELAAAARARAEQDQAAQELREAVGLRVRGSHAPAPVGTFDEMGEVVARSAPISWPTADASASGLRVWNSLSRVIEASDYKEPTAVQMQAVPVMLGDRDVLASAPTGSGKTAAYMLPVLARLRRHLAAGPRAVILAPTRELVQQIAREGRRLATGTGIRVVELTKGAAFGAFGAKKAAAAAAAADTEAAAELASEDEDEDEDEDDDDDDAAEVASKAGHSRKPKTPKQLEKQAIPQVDVLVTTPQRLAWLVEAAPADAGLALPHCGVVVLDEADRLLRRGDATGLRAVDAVLSAAPVSAQRAMFSATVHAGVEEAASSVLRDAVVISVGRSMAAAAGVTQKLVFVGREEGKLVELRQMASSGFDPPVLVFFQDQERADDAFFELSRDGVRCDVVHAGRPAAEREAAIRRFRAGEVWMLLATEVIARGIDFKAVRTVVNFDLPRSTSEYVHRIGRTGRAGRTGTAITLFTENDFALLRPIANVARISGADVPDWMLSLAKPSNRTRAAVPKRRAVSKARDQERYRQREAKREEQARRFAKRARRASAAAAAASAGPKPK